MISFFPSKLRLSDYSILRVDMHSHVLPGIDDGAKDVNESVKLLCGLKELGFKHCLPTPHISQEHHPNTPETIKAAHTRLSSALISCPSPMVGSPAAEYLLDEYLLEKIVGRDLLTLPGERVLFELSFSAPPYNIKDIVFALKLEGYQPVLAHPERYRYWSRHQSAWNNIIGSGCELQVNILSLVGHYGKRVQKTAYEILGSNKVDFLATDCHNTAHLSALKAGLKDRRLTRLLKEKSFANSKLIPQ